jgi:hypothetical protein
VAVTQVRVSARWAANIVQAIMAAAAIELLTATAEGQGILLLDPARSHILL